MATSEPRTVKRRFKRPLTDDELGRIEQALRTGGGGPHGPAAALVALWDVILQDAEGCTYAQANAEDRGFRPNDYAIPKAQADALLALMKGTRSKRVRNSVSMTWHNRGPASYNEAGA
jgi:hypothetical protein